MDEIDKRIEKIKKGTPISDCQGIIAGRIENDPDKKWLLDQLKKCRKILRDRERELKVREMSPAKLYPLVTQKERKEIEQRTKEACFKAGFAWIVHNIDEYSFAKVYEDSFKKAIDEAKE